MKIDIFCIIYETVKLKIISQFHKLFICLLKIMFLKSYECSTASDRYIKEYIPKALLNCLKRMIKNMPCMHKESWLYHDQSDSRIRKKRVITESLQIKNVKAMSKTHLLLVDFCNLNRIRCLRVHLTAKYCILRVKNSAVFPYNFE